MRYAIIGSGMMGQEHIENINLLPDSSVVALADPDEGMRSQAAGRCGPDVHSFADYKALLGATGIDALVIVTPNYTHRAIFELVPKGGRPEVGLHDGRMAVLMGAAAERSMSERVPVAF